MADDFELKEKLRQAIANTYKRDEIEIIKKTFNGEDRFSLNKEMRVCAYCRVSTDNIEQTTSYEFQRQEYTEKIMAQEKWKLVDIYADEGISGTSMLHRDSFNRMIADCKKGLIDLILVKSVSRFARNVVDCLSTVEKLQELNHPVRVIFEADNIDTAKPDSMLLLQIMAMLAENESRNKSDIMKWSYNHRNSIGRFMTPRLFGYEIDKESDQKYRIVEEEAEVIRLVYSMYAVGMSVNSIAEIMQKAGKVSNYKGECKWSAGVVHNILTNERRCGELLASKTFTVSFKTHKSIKNGPDVEFGPNQYFVREHHDPIVPIEMFEHVIKMRDTRKTDNFSGAFPTIRVIKEGVLKGFVSLCPKYTGFDLEDYMEASNCAFQNSKSERKEIEKTFTKGEFSHFDLDGFELVDSSLMSFPDRLRMTFDTRHVSFRKSCLDDIECEYVEILYEPHDNLIAIRGCEADHPNAIKWVYKLEEKPKMSTVLAPGIGKILFEANGWRSDFRINLFGETKSRAGDSVIMFDASNAEPMIKIDTVDGKRRTVGLFSKYLIDHFGEEFYQSKFSNRYYLMDVFKRWNLSAGLENTEIDPEWMKDAKTLVNEFLGSLKEE